ncbi:hypothetical protein ANN_13488, partial [Periplaneta americana]
LTVSLQNMSPKRLLLAGILIVTVGAVLGWYALPKLIYGQIAANINLKPGTDLREMWSNFPDPAWFKVYFFNVTNPAEIQQGGKPALQEIGPYVYDEYKHKADLLDHEEDDSISFSNRDTWYFNKAKSGELTGDEMITIPHMLVLGMVLTTEKDMKAMLPLITRSIPHIFGNLESVFLTARAKDLMFEGVLINCTIKDFTARMLCTLMRVKGKDLVKVGKHAFKFSFFGGRNGTLQERLRLKRGIQNVMDLGRVVSYKNEPQMTAWTNPKCNQYKGTDGSIFPPFLKEGQTIQGYAPELCRAMDAIYVGPIVFKGIRARIFSVDFGDMSSDPELKCYCATPKTCVKRGVHDLTRCVGAPLTVSLPHFYLSHEDYVTGVTGLNPQQVLHETTLYFEPLTGAPMLGYRRVQFNIKIHSVKQYSLMKDLRTVMFPILWVDEGIELDDKYINKLKLIFTIFMIIDGIKWIMVLVGIVLTGIGFFLLVQKMTGKAIVALGRNSPEVAPLESETPTLEHRQRY